MLKISEFTKSIKSLSKDVFVLSAGILIAQLIPLLLQPVLKRIFTPEDFGTYDVFLKSFGILVALSCLKYENAILLPKKDSDAKHVVHLCLAISASVFLLLVLAFFFLHDVIAGYLDGFTKLALILLPISVLSYSIFNIFNMYLIRRQRFMLSSTSKVSRRASEGIAQVIYGYLNNSNGLLIGDTIGNLIQGIYSFWKAQKISSFGVISKARIREVAHTYRELPIFTLVPNVLNTFVLGSLTFLILDKFSLEEVGYLEFTQKILSIPGVFISIAISQVVFQRVSQLINKRQKILPLLISVLVILFFLSIIFIIIIELFGMQIFVLIGGEGWENSGVYAKTLVYASAIMLIFSPLGKVLIALKKFKINSIWEIAKFLAILGLFYLDGYAIEEYLRIYTVVIIFFYLVYGITIIYQSRKYQLENQ